MVMRTREELDALAEIDPEIKAILGSGKFPAFNFDFNDSRKAVLQMREAFQAWAPPLDADGVSRSTVRYKARDGFEGRVLLFKSARHDQSKKLPLIVHLHGGGNAIGSPEGTAAFCQRLALRQHAVVASVEYRLAPEHPFPTGVEDCYDALRALMAGSADSFGADLGVGFVLGGHSAGAAMSACIALQLRDQALKPALTGLYYGAGAFIAPEQVPEGYEDWFISRNDVRCLDAPMLDRATKKMFDNVYQPDWKSPVYRACNYAGTGGLGDLPRTYLQICGMDILRDDSIIFDDLLRQHDVETRVDIYSGCPHVFWEAFRPGTIKKATQWVDDTQNGFGWLLGRKIDE